MLAMLVESWSLSSVKMQSFWRPLHSWSDWWRLPFFVRIAHSTSEVCWGSLLVPNLMWLTSMTVCRNFWKTESIYFLSSLISIRAASLNRSWPLILNWRRASSNSVAISLNLVLEEMGSELFVRVTYLGKCEKTFWIEYSVVYRKWPIRVSVWNSEQTERSE